MKTRILRIMLACIAASSATIAWSQDAPGSDPIVIGAAVSYLALPTPALAPSGQLDQAAELPSWIQAKVTRYEAKAFSDLEGESGTIRTERDVISSQKGNALQRNCTTEVASNSYAGAAAGPANRYGPGKQDQIVVLRGDVVTICK